MRARVHNDRSHHRNLPFNILAWRKYIWANHDLLSFYFGNPSSENRSRCGVASHRQGGLLFPPNNKSVIQLKSQLKKCGKGRQFAERRIFLCLKISKLNFYRTQVSLGSGLWVPASLRTSYIRDFVKLCWCDSGWWWYQLNMIDDANIKQSLAIRYQCHICKSP